MPNTPSDNTEARTDYIRHLFASSDAFLNDIERDIFDRIDPIHLRPEDAKILHILIKLGQIKNIVEIGTLAGYSAIWMARALPQDGHIYTIEHDPTRADIAAKNFKDSDVTERITLIRGLAQEELKTLSNNAPYDMIFIDADKPSYEIYLDWAELHIRKGGLIIGDNTLLFGAVYDQERNERNNPTRKTTVQTMKNFNARLANTDKYDSILLPTKEGMTIAIKKF